MLKILSGVFLGIFVGTVAYEALKRTKPDLLTSLSDRAQSLGRSFVDAFQEGYRGDTPSS